MTRQCGLSKHVCDRRCRRNFGPTLETEPPQKRCREDVIQLRDVAAKKGRNASESNRRDSVFPCADPRLFESGDPKSKAEADPILDGTIDEARSAAPKCFEFPGKGQNSKQNILSRVSTGWKRFWYACKRVDSIQILVEVSRSQEGCAV
ncbi:hypothetical protein MPTK1_2g23290 [Marchantia polymorpha subsp. ruderalis]|uniref:Uncharacterized protein n=1 Tax=Marchantia polymorpha TaxID=3197 RepID=A0A2R6WN08_MARPO|nr:hypothetical protein MARPO_0072s0001 [Marchantia polymorpha]BBN03413.1 hypothetical protein Mp_2g23290 [Marchantia polymorpha subsp. ruderalis]|eukprot:PTQ35237.1 hypothetical protein MARPO_0072s0001 [Marchantia polymorpha]